MRNPGLATMMTAALAAALVPTALAGCAGGAVEDDASSQASAVAASSSAVAASDAASGGAADGGVAAADGDLVAVLDAAFGASPLDNVTVSLDIAADVVDADGTTSRTNLTGTYEVDWTRDPGRLHLVQDVLSNVQPETKTEYYLVDGQGLVAVFDDKAVSMTQEQADVADAAGLLYHMADSAVLRELPGRAASIQSEERADGGLLVECALDVQALADLGMLGDMALPADMPASEAFVDYVMGADGRISQIRVTYDLVTSAGSQWLYELVAAYSAYGETAVGDAPEAVTYDAYLASLDSASSAQASTAASGA